MVKAIVITVVTALFLVFAANNHDTMDIGLFPLPYTITLPKFLFAIGCFALGVLVGGFSVNLKLNKTRRQFKSEHKRVIALQHEIKTIQEREPKKLTAA